MPRSPWRVVRWFVIAGFGFAALLGMSIGVAVLLGLLPVDWARLSDIGQSFGAASAVFAALALVAVSYATIVQARQAEMVRRQAALGFQLDLMTLAMDDGSLYGLEPSASAAEVRTFRQRTYGTLSFRYLMHGFVTREFSEKQLRVILAGEYFSLQIFRSRWAQVRAAWFEFCRFGLERRFCEIAAEEWERAEAAARANPGADQEGGDPPGAASD